jgi:dipeptidyl aminopeptidase/acylaminoacyl peptidase
LGNFFEKHIGLSPPPARSRIRTARPRHRIFEKNIADCKVDRIKTPLFVIHGKNDPRVPYTEAEQIVKVLKDKGAIVEYKLYDDEGHGISKLKNRLELYPLVADFLDKYMK